MLLVSFFYMIQIRGDCLSQHFVLLLKNKLEKPMNALFINFSSVVISTLKRTATAQAMTIFSYAGTSTRLPASS